MKLTERRPTDRDKAWLKTAHHAAYHDVVVRQFGSWEEQRQDGFFERKWSNANLSILVADGIDCGFATVEERADGLQLVELVIHPDHQEKKIGTTFLQQLIARAVAGQVALRLEVLHANRATQLYRRLGFQERGRTDTHILMEYCLQP